MNTAIAYEYESEQGVIMFGAVLVKGCPPNKKNSLSLRLYLCQLLDA